MGKKNHAIWDNEELLIQAVSEATSIAEVLSHLGLNRNSGNYQTLKSRCLRFGITLPTFDNSLAPMEATRMRAVSDEEVLSNRGIKTTAIRLKLAMKRLHNIEDVCIKCGQEPIWNGLPLVLELDHIDGNCFNNEIENLRILCGHCHSQTPNFRGRNRGSENYRYCDCGKKLWKKSKKCQSCAPKSQPNAGANNPRYPQIQEIYTLFLELKTFIALGKHFGVSNNAVKKHIQALGYTMEEFKLGKFDS